MELAGLGPLEGMEDRERETRAEEEKAAARQEARDRERERSGRPKKSFSRYGRMVVPLQGLIAGRFYPLSRLLAFPSTTLH